MTRIKTPVVLTVFLSLAIVSTMPTTSYSQEVLPRPEEAFKGKIGLTYKDSEAVKPKLKVPATFGLENPPNILIVLIDDCGYGQMGTFGGAIPTPTLDRVAQNGLRYTLTDPGCVAHRAEPPFRRNGRDR